MWSRAGMMDCGEGTFSDSLNGALQVSIGLLKSQDKIDVRPSREQLFQHAQLRGVLLFQLAEFALICRGVDCGVLRISIRLFGGARCASVTTSTAAG